MCGVICIVVFGCNVLIVSLSFVFGVVVGVIDFGDIVLVLVVGFFGVGKSFKFNLFVSEIFGLVNFYVVGGMYWYIFEIC